MFAELVVCGVAYHHAGLDPTDRKAIEAMFTRGDLPVLCRKPMYYLELKLLIQHNFDPM